MGENLYPPGTPIDYWPLGSKEPIKAKYQQAWCVSERYRRHIIVWRDNRGLLVRRYVSRGAIRRSAETQPEKP